MIKLMLMFQTMHPPLTHTRSRSHTNLFPTPPKKKHPTYVVPVVQLLDKSMFNLKMASISGRNMKLCLIQ